MTRWKWVTSFVIFLTLLTLTLSQTNASEPNHKRLIRYESEPGSGVIERWVDDSELDRLSLLKHEQGVCGGFFDITGRKSPGKHQAPPFRSYDFGVPTHQNQVEALLPELSIDNLSSHVENLQEFHNRYYRSQTGVDAAEWIHTKFIEYAGSRTDIQVEFFRHDDFPQPSVIATIQGNGSHSDEIIVIGAHEDSIKSNGFFPEPTGRAPGADDDASGASTVLETFRVLAQSGFQPQRTLQFMTYAGEERGLLGSQDIAEFYAWQQKQIIAVLQLDMTMYPGRLREIVLIDDYIDSDLTRFVGALIDNYVRVAWSYDRCGYACSDHASWNRYGFSAAMPFEASSQEMNRNLHTPNDVIDILSMEHGLHYAKIALAFAVELSL